MRKTKLSNAIFIANCLLCMLVGGIQNEIMLPSFLNLASFLNVDNNHIKITTSLCFLGSFMATIFYGPSSEFFGRRKVLIFSCFITCVGILGCFLSSSYKFFAFFRIIEGIGIAGPSGIVFLMIKDTYDDYSSIKLISFVTSILVVFASLSPVIGAFLNNHYYGWRGGYGFLFLISVLAFFSSIFFCSETKKSLSDYYFIKKSFLDNYTSLIKNATFLSAAIVPSLFFANNINFSLCAAFIYTNQFQLTPFEYATHQSIVTISFCIASFFSFNLKKFWKTNQSVKLGYLICIVSSIMILFCKNAVEITMCIILHNFGFAMCYYYVFNLSLKIFSEIKGYAIAFIMLLRAIICAVVIAGTNLFNSNNLEALGYTTIFCSMLAWLLGLFLLKKTEKNLILH
jgi:DHA1 family bicyclomycin/chloramphenicol resistance-like MFS transporter